MKTYLIHLDSIAGWLKELGYTAELQPKSAHHPIEYLKVRLNLGDASVAEEMLVYLLEQVGMPNLEEGKAPEPLYSCIMEIPLKTPCTSEALMDLMRLLHFLNHMSDLPGWQLDEVQKQVRFRVVQLIPQQGLTKTLLLSLIGSAGFQVSLFMEAIHKMSQGKLGFIEYLKAPK